MQRLSNGIRLFSGFRYFVLSMSMLLLTLAGFARTHAASTAQENGQPSPANIVWQYGGANNSVTVRDKYAFAGVGPRLVILDLSDVQQPQEVGKSAPMFGIVEKIALQGDFAYSDFGIDSNRWREYVICVRCCPT